LFAPINYLLYILFPFLFTNIFYFQYAVDVSTKIVIVCPIDLDVMNVGIVIFSKFI
jgi:hypothetical protein